MQLYNLITIIVVLTAVFGYINFRFIKLPGTIGIMLISLVASLFVIAIDYKVPSFFVASIDFDKALMNVMLSFLLFAGAIHINVRKLSQERIAVITFSTIGLLISTVVIAALLFVASAWLGISLNIINCLLFGALISPTDPIAVLGILKKANIPSTLETKISGESLFNDGVAVVVFVTIRQVLSTGIQHISAGNILWLFVREAGGGILFGWLLGYICFLALKSIDQYIIEVGITLSIVMGGYSLANYLHVSGPLAMVVTGLMIGNKSEQLEMSAISRDYMNKFWEMLDEFLNGILFLLIGFQMLVIHFNLMVFWLGCISIVIVLIARLISVALPIFFLKFKKTFEKNAISILTWGGLRGGISVALALSLPKTDTNEIFVAITYIIVLFSIIVQGLTIGKFAKKLA